MYSSFLFFSNATATTQIYTLSLHDALPISRNPRGEHRRRQSWRLLRSRDRGGVARRAVRSEGSERASTYFCGLDPARSEEHTSELQSHVNLVCRLLLEKKK